jgi:Sulfotransferase family
MSDFLRASDGNGGREHGPWGEPSDVDRPIFIVGCPRSGTSILRMTLDSHPRISAGPEEASLYWLSQTDGEVDVTRREGYGVSEEKWREMVREIVGSVQSRYAASQGKTRWALKHPELANRLPWVDRVYPNSQVIHIVRSPRDVIASCQKKFGLNASAEYGRRWVRYVRHAEDDGKKLGPDRFLTIRYEDFAAKPEIILREVVEWLGEPWSDEVLQPYSRSHRFPVMPTESKVPVAIHTGSIGKGRGQLLSLPSLMFVRMNGKDLVDRFGYEASPFPR